ncbi:NFYB/HAP3 family transcription factor subunit [Candidatus Woesearchaeota archaeon]|nr:NFYB/HAP3 family transcription factor subunit [Candidatus Woesearchaeota archaeon]
MQRNTSTIPKAVAARLLMNAGAKRVSQDAADAFAEVMEKISQDIGRVSNDIAKHSGRKTVQDGDIKLAKDKLYRVLG